LQAAALTAAIMMNGETVSIFKRRSILRGSTLKEMLTKYEGIPQLMQEIRTGKVAN
jgi:hypothetical protein